jgi:isoquinoline 1-oxidoreductase subunit beta
MKAAANSTTVSRRKFLISSTAAGGGLALGFPLGALAQKAPGTVGSEVGAWVFIKPSEEIVIRIARSEMGQGTLTGLAQFVAEELECDWDKVRTEYPTPGQNIARNRIWRDFFTAGSQGIRNSQEFVRKGGAAARMMLVEAAAKEWNVPASELAVDKGVITHAKSNRKITYGKIASAAAKLEVPKEADIKLKDPKDWKIAGQSLKRLDTPDKLTGKQIYSIDVKLPGMLNASIMDAPVFDAKLKSYDDTAAKAMPGVRHVLRVGETAVAVVADTWWQANQALKAVKITWEEGPNDKVSSETIAAFLKEGLTATENIFVGNKAGDAIPAIAGAAKKIDAVTTRPISIT